MSYMFCSILYKVGEFDVDRLKELTATPLDDRESLREVSLNQDVNIIFYIPPKGRSKADGYEEGYEWFTESLASTIEGMIREQGDEQAVFVFCYEDMSLSRCSFKITNHTFDYRFVSDGRAHRQIIQDDEEIEAVHANTEIDAADFGLVGEDDSSFDEDAYHEAVRQAEAPFCPIVLLKREMGVTVDEVIDAYHKLREGGRIVWP